jgi:hypothetical protein
MPEIGDSNVEDAERWAANADREKQAWEATLEDMEAMADDLEAEGWETVAIPAGHTAPENPDSGDHDRFGLTHVIPDNFAEAFTDAFSVGDFPQFEVYRAEQEGRVFLVTVLMDPDAKQAILLAGTYEIRHALGCVKAAEEAGEMYTHVVKLDETHLGSFRHDGYEKFFPDVATVKNWAIDPERRDD